MGYLGVPLAEFTSDCQYLKTRSSIPCGSNPGPSEMRCPAAIHNGLERSTKPQAGLPILPHHPRGSSSKSGNQKVMVEPAVLKHVAPEMGGFPARFLLNHLKRRDLGSHQRMPRRRLMILRALVIFATRSTRRSRMLLKMPLDPASPS